MILPHPESDLTSNPMVLGAEILREVRQDRSVLLESLLVKMSKSNKKITLHNFMEALIFLYIVNLIEIDAFRIQLVDNA